MADAPSAPAGAVSNKSKKRNRIGEDQTLEEARANWTQCLFLMKRKNRLCNVARAPGSMYCGNHCPVDETVSSGRRLAEAKFRGIAAGAIKRVPCPMDPNHTVYEHELAHHLKICNVGRMQNELQAKGYYCQDCNSIGNAVTEKGSNEVDPAVLLTKIKLCYQAAVEPELTEGPSVLDASVKDTVLEAVGGASTTFSKVRHNLQDAYLVQKMLANGVLTVDSGNGKIVVVELGAGRGMLGLAIMSVLPTSPAKPDAAAHLLMIERNGLKFKADKILRERSMGHNRVRMDIRHCFLPKLPVIADYDSLRAAGHPPSVVLVAKHLCGLATDLSVSSIHNLVRENTSASASAGPAFQGLAIATCCHHACSWVDYTGVDWLCTEQGFTEAEFSVMKQWSGWAHTIKFTDEEGKVSESAQSGKASGSDEEVSTPNEEEAECCEHSAPVNESTVRPAGLTSREMSDVGKMVKRILDQGRVMYLRRLGLPARQVRYCDPSLSPECYMIIATTGGEEASRTASEA